MKNSRIFPLAWALLFSFALLGCGGGGDSGSNTTASSTSSTNAIGQLSQELADKGKPSTIITPGNQQSQLASALEAAAFQSPAVTVASPAVQLETTLIQLSR